MFNLSKYKPLCERVRTLLYSEFLGEIELLPNLVYKRLSCGVAILVWWLGTVEEIEALNDVGEMEEAPQLAPASFSALAEFEHHVQYSIAGEATTCPLDPESDVGEVALDWFRGPNTLPMLSWETLEGQQLIAILKFWFNRLRILCLRGLDEQIECNLRLHAGFGLPDEMQHLFGLGLDSLGQVT